MQAHWFSFECNVHGSTDSNGFIDGSGLVFDVRIDSDPDRAALTSAKCPVCGSTCEMLGWWPADEQGYKGPVEFQIRDVHVSKE